MSSSLEKFMKDNRESFDADEPSHQVWEKLQAQLNPADSRKKVIRLLLLRWTAAAAAVILVVTAIFLLNRKPATEMAKAEPPPTDLLKEINPNYAKQVYHFTQLIELKQEELKQIEKDQPELYQKFISDITALDSSYNALQKELPENPNREKLLEAMIQNLRLQTELLNQQLLIIQKIKQSKNTNDENNSKST